jgi:hypothetical protein
VRILLLPFVRSPSQRAFQCMFKVYAQRTGHWQLALGVP